MNSRTSKVAVHVRLWRYYNWVSGARGEPFGLCDPCWKATRPAYEFSRDRLAWHTALPCVGCGARDSSCRPLPAAPAPNLPLQRAF
jgi:hypothetical protein